MVSTALAALHVYTCCTDLNWDSSYMVSGVMDSFTATHHVRDVANTVAVLVATFGKLREHYQLSRIITADI